MPILVQPGDCVGNYRVLRILGQGGMGSVYEVEHMHIGRRAAMKLLMLDVRSHPQVFQRFVNEARAANQINHPGVVQVYEFGQLGDGTPWMLMQFLPGDSLEQRLRGSGNHERRVIPLTTTLTILHQLATILCAAHDTGIVHRDLKPGNIILVPDPAIPIGVRVHLLDFGIAKLMGDTLQAEGGDASSFRTASGAILGTPAYMAPEQCKGAANIDAKADVYAVGVIAFQMLSGHLPFWDKQSMNIMAGKILEDAPPITQFVPAIPKEVSDLIASLLEREPLKRPNISQLEQTLLSLLQQPAHRRSGFQPAVMGPPPFAGANNPPEPANPQNHPVTPVLPSDSFPLLQSAEELSAVNTGSGAGASLSPSLASTASGTNPIVNVDLQSATSGSVPPGTSQAESNGHQKPDPRAQMGMPTPVPISLSVEMVASPESNGGMAAGLPSATPSPEPSRSLSIGQLPTRPEGWRLTHRVKRWTMFSALGALSLTGLLFGSRFWPVKVETVGAGPLGAKQGAASNTVADSQRTPNAQTDTTNVRPQTDGNKDLPQKTVQTDPPNAVKSETDSSKTEGIHTGSQTEGKPDGTENPYAHTRKNDSCQAPTLACVFGDALSSLQRAQIVSALHAGRVKLCKGDRFQLRIADRVAVKGAPSSVNRATREAVEFELNAATPKLANVGEVFVRCPK